MEVVTYGEYSQQRLGLTEDEWDRLGRYVAEIRAALTSEVNSADRKSVDDPPPYISAEGKFCPSGWVGHYPGDVVVIPRKLPSEEYAALLDDVQGWSELLGATTIGSVLPLSTDLLIDPRTEFATYSRALIEFTEMLRARRLPVDVSSEQYRDNRPRGRPVPTATMRESARGSEQIVSRSIEFSFESLPNLFLVRFHAELATEMSRLADEYDYYESAFDEQLSYHETFVTTGIPGELLDAALETSVYDPAVFDQARREAGEEMAEVLNLWDAYRRDVGFKLSITNRFDTATKPASKTYELWCLGSLLDIIADVTGATPSRRQELRRTYEFGSDLRLHYDQRVDTASNFLNPIRGLSPGRPDFVLEADDRVVWVGDAKFKTWAMIDKADYQQILTYVADLLAPDGRATIFYAGDGTHDRADALHGRQITHVTFRPDQAEELCDSLTTDFEAILG